MNKPTYYIDTHAHLYRKYYPEDLQGVIQRAVDARVERVLLACVDENTPPMIAEAVEMFPENIFGLIGLHPSDVKEDYETQLAELEKHIGDRNIVGIGEIGLDFYHDRDFEKEQQIVFRRQLDWARDRKLPLSLHIRNGYSEAIPILDSYPVGSLRGVLHCFSGGIQEAEWAARHGFVIGIGGIVTFKNSKLQELIPKIGLDRIVLETDAPYLAPTPHRGTPNESSYIPLIAQKIAEIMEVPVKEVMERTTENALRIFFNEERPK
ncbi:MAG: TatD family hydrolase [Bacteroidales bacterium]|nr:TatD family hydrolase [Bacteroidales bacterium]